MKTTIIQLFCRMMPLVRQRLCDEASDEIYTSWLYNRDEKRNATVKEFTKWFLSKVDDIDNVNYTQLLTDLQNNEHFLMSADAIDEAGFYYEVSSIIKKIGMMKV